MFNGFCHGNAIGTAAAAGPAGWTGAALVALLFVAVLVGLVVLSLSAIRRTRAAAGAETNAGEPDAMQALQVQYARGEINREQYRHRKQQLS